VTVKNTVFWVREIREESKDQVTPRNIILELVLMSDGLEVSNIILILHLPTPFHLISTFLMHTVSFATT
jgi:hypothetical protein